MRLERITVAGFGPYRGELSLDLTDLDARLVAVTGPNGSGKSTLLELWGPGAMYRATPTRGSLGDLATSRTSRLEASITAADGERWTLRHTVDSHTGKGESVAIGADGRPTTASGKVRDFDRWAAEHLPSPEILYASTFASQQSGGFLAMKPAERKQTLVRLLGVERLERLAEQARRRADAAATELRTLESRKADERRRAVPLFEAENRHEIARADRDESAALAANLAAELDEARELAAAAELAITRERARERRLADAQTHAESLETELLRLDADRVAAFARVERADAIKAAAARADEIGREIAWSETRLAELAAEARSHRAAAESHARAERTARHAESAARSRANDERQELDKRAGLEALAARAPQLRLDERANAERLERAERGLEMLLDSRTDVADRRIQWLRHGLETIGQAAVDPVDVAARTLAHDDAEIERQANLPGDIAAASRAVQEAKRATTATASAILLATKAAEQIERITEAEARLADAEREAAEAAELAEREAAEASAAGEQAAAADHSIGNLDGALRALRLDWADPTIAGAAAELAELYRTEARLAELERQKARATESLEKCRAELAAAEASAEPIPPAPSAADLAELSAKHKAVVDWAARATAAEARAAEALQQANDSAAHSAELESRSAAAADDAAAWHTLAADLGRDGLQALEIDSAAPELSELANDLLRTCVGPRWTVAIETQRSSADGKRQIEGCAVRVVDTEHGRDAEASSYSPGERVLLGEAVGLALAMVACRRAGIERPTLVRDESGAALDPVASRAYVAMLRRAADIVGADRVLFVSHNPETQAAADARIEILPGGGARIT